MMEKSNRVVPKMRFKEFEGLSEWQKYKLADYADFRRGSFPQPYGKSEWYDGSGSMPFVQVVDVGSNLKLVDKTKQKISVLAQPKSIFVRKNTVVVTLQGSIGRVAITQYDSYLDRTLLIFQSYKEKTDKRFWAYTIQQKFNTEKEKAPGGTIKTITKESLSNFEVFIPTYGEQQKIGHFFEIIDEMIQVQQSKVNKVKDIKSAYLSEMFPKEGEKYPKKRFDGFTKEWSFKKLEALTTTFTDGDWIESKDQSDSGVRLIQTGNIGITKFLDKPKNKKWISKRTFTKLNCEEIFPGDILISRLPEPAGRATIIPELNTRMITAVDCTIVRPSSEYSSDFLIQYLSTSNYFNKITAELAGGTRQRISRSNLAEVKVPVPKTLEEQEKIGQFFKNLDNQISVEENKLAKLEKLKQAYLSDMFV